MGSNTIDVKQNNIHIVLQTLSSVNVSTTKDLAQMTGLSFATVGNILNVLIERGEVVLGEQIPSTGGRPSQTYIFNAEFAHVLAMSVRVQKGDNVICACVGNLNGEAVWQTEQCFENIKLTSFETLVDSCLKTYPTIRVLSFSLPGVEHNGVIISNDYTELVGINFKDYFQRKYQLTVTIENDVNAAVLGYGKSIDKVPVIVGIYFPKYFNPGAGIMIDGKILKGAHGYAGEITLSSLGIDWLSINYKNPQKIGSTIYRLICIFYGILNPNYVILYGDFFSDAIKETIEREITTKTIKNTFPTIIYQSNLDTDINAGLISQAISVYQSNEYMK